MYYVFLGALGGILVIFLVNPLLTWLSGLHKKSELARPLSEKPLISLIVIARYTEKSILAKIQNALALDYPEHLFEMIVYFDGEMPSQFAELRIHPKVRIFSSTSQIGKNNAMNEAVKNARGEILIFSDADARIHSDALTKLLPHFSDPHVGGVCGKMLIRQIQNPLHQSQASYFFLDTKLKQMESKARSVSSNYGTLYAIRKSLYHDVPPDVTDDLYLCLQVNALGYRFEFEPEARVYIQASSRTPSHEIQRRRRIVCRSLSGIYRMRAVLNPLRYGVFSFNVLMNKVFRRFLPIFILLAFVSSLYLSFFSSVMRGVVALQLVFYAFVLCEGFGTILPKGLQRISSLAFYFCIGNIGTLLGLWDFMRGKRVVRWS